MKRADSGESLIELIIAMAILGVTMVTVVAGFLNLSRLSGIQHDQGTAFAALTSASEYAKNRSCLATCPLESDVPVSLVPHDADTTISISAPSTSPLGPSLTQFVVTVTTGTTSYSNTVVVR